MALERRGAGRARGAQHREGRARFGEVEEVVVKSHAPALELLQVPSAKVHRHLAPPRRPPRRSDTARVCVLHAPYASFPSPPPPYCCPYPCPYCTLPPYASFPVPWRGPLPRAGRGARGAGRGAQEDLVVHGDPVEAVVAHHPRNLRTTPSACQSARACARRGGGAAGRRVARARVRAVSPGTRLLVAPQVASLLAVSHAEGRAGVTSTTVPTMPGPSGPSMTSLERRLRRRVRSPGER